MHGLKFIYISKKRIWNEMLEYLTHKPHEVLFMKVLKYVYIYNILSRSEIHEAIRIYRQISNIRRTLVGNTLGDHSDVVGASPVGAAPTTSLSQEYAITYELYESL